MRFQPSEIIGMASGKGGGKVYAAVKGSSGKTIQTIKNYTKPYNPNTVDQQNVRKTFAFAMKIFTSGVNQTIGAAVWVQNTWLAEVQAAAQALDWYGVANAGTYAGRQVFISGFVSQYSVPAVVAVVADNIVPGGFILEAKLAAFIDVIDVTMTEVIPTLKQTKKIGYLNVNPSV